MAQPYRLSLDQAQEMILFRNGRGSQVDFPGNKGGCRSYASGFLAVQSGTIPAKFAGVWYTPGGQLSQLYCFQPRKKLFLL